MKTVVQNLMGKTEEWERVNPVLLKGMLGIEECSGGKTRIKIGDGKKNWKSLPLINFEDLGLAEEAKARDEADQHLQKQINNLMPEGLEYLSEKLVDLEEKINAESGLREEADQSIGNDLVSLQEELTRVKHTLNEVNEQLNNNVEKRVVGTYHISGVNYTDEELAANRWLKLEYTIIEIAKYQELCDRKWCGAEANDTALFWYKCNENGTRNIDGLYMRTEDIRGLFMRAAGMNAILKAANYTPYDGNTLGSFNPHVTEKHRHTMFSKFVIAGNQSVYYNDPSCKIKSGNDTNPYQAYTYTEYFGGNETSPAWIAVNYYIQY